MRTTFSSFAVMASSLLVREVFAAPHGHAHANVHAKRDYYLDTDNVIVTEEVWVTELADGSLATGAPVAVGTITIDGSAVLVTEPVPTPTIAPATTEIAPTPTVTPSTSSTPIPEPATSSSIADAVFIEAKPSSTSIYVAPTTSSTSIYVAPTTSEEAPVVVPTPTTLATSVYVAPTTSTSAAPVAITSASSSSSGKRGGAYNDVSLLSALSGSSEVTWCYNWGSTTPSGVPSSMEYVPMLWGLDSGDLNNWDEAVSTAKAAGSTHLLYVNEPDYSGQANLGYAEAAAGYLKYFQSYASDFKLVGPAVTNGGGEMGLTWLGNFMTACSSCTIDAIAIHWYNGGDAAAFKEYMAKAYTAGGNRPLWISEFQASGTTEEQAAFLTEVMAWMDETSYIERYAYFMVSDGNLVSGTSLSTLGNTYAASS